MMNPTLAQPFPEEYLVSAQPLIQVELGLFFWRLLPPEDVRL
jgi:hypothetical protein